MAYSSLIMENPKTGQIKEAPVGFSWTVLFFNFFPALCRGDYKWSIIMFLAASLSAGLSCLVFMFIYNKIYIKELISNGFKVKSVSEGTFDEIIAKLGIKHLVGLESEQEKA